MRRMNLILLLLGMLFAAGIVAAQEEETILYVHLTCDCDEYPVFNEIIQELEANLAEYDIGIEFIPENVDLYNSPDWPEYLSIRLAYDVAQAPDGSIIFVGYNYRYETASQWLNHSFAEISPLLEGNLSYSDKLGECRPLNSCDFQVNLLTKISLYMLNRCEILENLPATDNYGAGIVHANCAILQGDYLQAQDILELINSSTTAYSVSQLRMLAWLYIQNEQAEDAISLMNDLIEQEKENLNSDSYYYPFLLVEGLKSSAQIYALALDYDSAIADIDEAIALAEANEAHNSTLAELYTIRGQIIFLIYEWDRVLENFNHAIELDPNYALAYFQRGVLYYTMTQRENALADFEHYLELEPDGLYAEEAAQYIESIQIELDALGG